MQIRRHWWIFVVLVYLVASWFSAGFHQSDEHFQILEFAGLHLGINKPHDLAWEYHEQMRPTLQPMLAYGVHRSLAAIGLDNPFHIAWVLRLLSALFSLGVAYLLYQVFRSRYGDGLLAWWFFLWSFLLWFGVYNGIRFNSETWAANCFALALGLYWYWKHPQMQHYLLLGMLVGLAFLFRFQVAFMIAGWGLWLIFVARERWHRLLVFTLAGLAVAAAGILIDYWFYGEWVFSAWNYFEQNIILDKASNFGVDPWWQYFSDVVIKGIPPFSLLYLVGIFAFIWWYPRHEITWVSIPFLLAHGLVAHKELRFLYPLLPLLPIVMAEVSARWEKTYGQSIYQKAWVRWTVRLFWGHNAILLLFISFWSIIPEMSLYRTIYQHYDTPITLYGIDDNPYRLALDIHYYRRTNLCVQEVKTLESLPRYGRDTYLVAIDRKKMDQWDRVPGKKTLVYSSYPDWIWSFNFNNWLSRSQWWYVYEVRPRE
jgi:phosphatidylinositol glycan class B